MSSLDPTDRKRYAYKILNDEPVHASSEVTAFSMLIKAVEMILEQLNTTIETDLELLESSALNDDGMFAVVSFRLFQKQALQRCLRISKRYIDTILISQP